MTGRAAQAGTALKGAVDALELLTKDHPGVADCERDYEALLQACVQNNSKAVSNNAETITTAPHDGPLALDEPCFFHMFGYQPGPRCD
jgi:hypothetical protein